LLAPVVVVVVHTQIHPVRQSTGVPRLLAVALAVLARLLLVVLG
jgi:hypothetical protein